MLSAAPDKTGPGDYLPLVRMALQEDLGDLGDITSQAVVPDGERSATLWSKDDGVLAGEEIFRSVLREVDPSAVVLFQAHDGARLARGMPVASVRARAISILSAERTALNFISFLSGIATATRKLVDLAEGRAVILDTRKTLPGFRALSKYAVTVGGGSNHRQGLYDMVLIKDNHVDSAGSVAAAVQRVRDRWARRFPVEVECRTEAEVRDAVAAGVDVILLDNMTTGQMRQAAALVGGRAKVEASGNMTAERIGEVSATGVDYISVGALTHSVASFDFSLKID
ncbi:MAG TPA: carboxylating nicotinate-nucleotide diphosphorylase [Spirochaetia bacterium]|nr:carboxylating nicotinate-nucleotide diphosphorylase [Spirochaetia bacterium]